MKCILWENVVEQWLAQFYHQFNINKLINN